MIPHLIDKLQLCTLKLLYWSTLSGRVPNKRKSLYHKRRNSTTLFFKVNSLAFTEIYKKKNLFFRRFADFVLYDAKTSIDCVSDLFWDVI